jgi:hypothetical protein
MQDNLDDDQKYDENTNTYSHNETSSCATPLITRDLHRNFMINLKESDV